LIEVMRHETGGMRAIERRETAPPGPQLRAHGAAGITVGRIRRRHPHVPVLAVALDQSNKWDELKQVRLSATRRTCTILRSSPCVPWVFQLGSRGNPTNVSNTAGDAENHSTRRLRHSGGA